MPEITIQIVRYNDPFTDPNFSIDKNATVDELYQAIFSWWGIPVEEQLLAYYKEILITTKTLAEYGIGKGSKIILLQQIPGFMPVNVNVSGKIVKIRVRRQDTIYQVKERVAQREANLVPSAFRLVLGSSALSDTSRVMDCSITINSTLVYQA